MTTVLRRAPAARLSLARTLAPGADDVDATWWELVDLAAPPGSPPVGVALTRTDSQGSARVVALTPPVPRLVRELVAALRRTDALSLELPSRSPGVLEGLSCEDVDDEGPHLIVRF